MLFFGEPREDGDVRLAERQAGEVATRDPADLLAGQRPRLLARMQAAAVERELHLEVRVDVLDPRVLLADGGAHAQLLAQLARERGSLSLVWLHLPAGEFPERAALALGPPQGDQHLAVALD